MEESHTGPCADMHAMYTYPAYSFGGQGLGRGEKAPPGPGPGKHAHNAVSWSAPAMRFGPPRRPSGPYYTAGTTTNITKPGALSQERRGPSYSFGPRLPAHQPLTPGPLDNRPTWSATAKARPQPSFGPPPKPRPMSAPRPVRYEHVPPSKPRGPTFGLKYAPFKQDPVPGPSGYCDGGCAACNKYKGASFGLRPPMMYGQKHGLVGQSPGPQRYHVGCSTLGAATRRSATSQSQRPQRGGTAASFSDFLKRQPTQG